MIQTCNTLYPLISFAQTLKTATSSYGVECGGTCKHHSSITFGQVVYVPQPLALVTRQIKIHSDVKAPNCFKISKPQMADLSS